ncbi:hypothetical protein C8Q74DRAFT_1222393 [Fomes fomentarius]|nr:hypothetical protein C8Q74DRAFT_1222393 [Fomes fomentarius]
MRGSAFLLIPALLFLSNGALADELVAAKSLKKGTPLTLSRRQATNGDDNDGCPSGWAECSLTTCYPLDGSQCCLDGNYCDAGYVCVFDLTGEIKCRQRLSGAGLTAGPAGGAALAGLLGVAMAYMG